MVALLPAILLEGLKFLNEKARTRIMDDYHDVLKDLNKAKNKIGQDDYTDIDIAINAQRFESFMAAYHKELVDA